MKNTIVKKIGFWGSIASIVGLFITLFPFSENSLQAQATQLNPYEPGKVNKSYQSVKTKYTTLLNQSIIVAVLPFEDKDNNSEVNKYSQKTRDLIIEKLISQNINVVNRSHIDPILKEIKFRRTKLVNKKAYAELGKILGASVLIVGSIYNYRENSYIAPYSTERFSESRIELTINYISVEDGQQILTHSLEGDVTEFSDLGKPTKFSAITKAIQNYHGISIFKKITVNRHDE